MRKIPYKTNQSDPVVQEYIKAVKKGEKDLHVIPRTNGWIVKNLLSEKISKIFHTQQDAVNYAESNASRGTSIFIHTADGLMAQRNGY